MSEILQHQQVQDESFWTEKIKDPVELKTRYAEYCRDVPTYPNVIFYESMSGARMMDSPYALFRHWHAHPRFAEVHHVWSVRSPKLIPEEYRDDSRVSFVTRGTDAYLYFLARAKHVVGNSVLPDYFVRKHDQKYLNTWHGIAYKGIGRDSSAPLGAAGSVYNMLQATHVLTPCPFMTEAQLQRLSMRGVHAGSLAEIGYPRQDLTVNISDSRLEELKEQLKLDPSKKTVLYAPTWRGNKGSARFDATQLESDLKRLAELDANIVFQAHHIMLRHIKEVDYNTIIVPPTNIVTNELLAVVDLLISDYSSIFFDFLVTKRPVVHYVYDYTEYEAERGLSLDRTDLPGEIVDDPDDLTETVAELLTSSFAPSENYLHARERFCPHDDGHACERTTRWFIDGDDESVKTVETRSRRTKIFWGGRLDSSAKSRAFLDSVDAAAASRDFDVSLFVAHSVKGNKDALNRIRDLDPAVSIIARADFEISKTSAEIDPTSENAAVDSSEEETETARNSSSLITKLTSVFSRKPKQTNSAQPEQPSPKPTTASLREAVYEREYRRIFGDAKFDEVVEFPNLSPFWKTLAKHARS